MNTRRASSLGTSLGIVIFGLLIFIFIGFYYYLPALNQRINVLTARIDATGTPSTSANTGNMTDLTPRLADLEKNYTTLVSVINTKMPNVNLPALLAIANTKNMPSANVALVIALIENEPAQAKTYLTQTLSFNDNEVTQVMGPMDRYNKNKFGFKFLNHTR